MSGTVLNIMGIQQQNKVPAVMALTFRFFVFKFICLERASVCKWGRGIEREPKDALHYISMEPDVGLDLTDGDMKT